MPLRPGETFLQGSARVKQKPPPRLHDIFAPTLTPPKKVPPVPKAVKEWEKKTPTQKLKDAGFVGASVIDKEVTRYRYEREAARTAVARSYTGTIGRKDPKLVRQDAAIEAARTRAVKELARLAKVPQVQRKDDYYAKLNRARAKADPAGAKHALSYDITRGVLAGSKPILGYLGGRGAQPSEHVSYQGVPVPRVFEDIGVGAAKMFVAGIAGTGGAVRHPIRSITRDIPALVSDAVQPIGLAMKSTDSSAARQKLWETFVKETLTGMEEAYGPQASWSQVVREGYDQGLISAVQALAVVAPAFKGASIAGHMRKGVGPFEAARLSRRPATPRTVRLRGGEEAMGKEIEIDWSPSAFTRATMQRPYDVLSRRVSEETPILGKVSESARAARAERRNLKRDVRRAQAQAANVMAGLGRDKEAAQLRAVYMRGKPREMDEDEWLQAQLDDVNEMLEGRELIRGEPSSPKLAALRNKVDDLQRKFDRTRAEGEERLLGEKLAPYQKEIRSAEAKLKRAREKGSTPGHIQNLVENVADARERLYVAEGERVGALPETPARNQAEAVIADVLPAEQVPAAMSFLDQLARGARPEDPSGWIAERLSAVREADPEASGLDYANALFQEAGPRESLSRAGFFDDQVEAARRWDTQVETPEGPGFIQDFDHDTRTADVLVEGSGGQLTRRVKVSYDDLSDPAGNLGIQEAPVFYSSTQKVVHEKFPDKVNPDQLISLLEKGGIKKVELEWTGLLEYAQGLKDSGIKSVSKEEVIAHLANPLNAFDLAETLWVEDYSSHHRTKWDPENYTGVTLEDIPGDYKELMVQLPGEQVYQSSGHMPGITNPLVQLRFHEVNQRDYNEILIDEMQSDWAAALRDVDYEAKGKDSEARLEAVRAERTKLQMAHLDRVLEALQIPYDAIPGGTSEFYSVHSYVKNLRQRLDSDFQKTNEGGVTYSMTPAQAANFEAWRQTPERKLVERLERYGHAVSRRMETLNGQERKIVNAPADMPYKKTWELLGLKRMVAYAVAHGFDAISWPQGIVPAVRYQKVDVEGYREPEYEDPSDHPSYPDASDYQRGYVHRDYNFPVYLGDPEGPHQERLFGIFDPEYGWDTNAPGPVPMSETTPLQMSAEELGYSATQIEDGFLPGVDELIFMTEGPFANQFVRVTRDNRDGSYDVLPSAIDSIEFQGDSHDDGGYSEFNVTVTENGRQSYGSGSSPGDALRNANYDDVADSEWFDDVERSLDNGWTYETDDYLYDEAVKEFMDRWNDGEIEGSHDYAERNLASAEDIADLDYSHYKGNAYRYDTIFPSAARKEWKKYGVEVERSSVQGSFTVEGEGRVSDVGEIPTWRMEIPEKLAEDVRQGQSFFQATYPVSGGPPQVKGAVELLENDQYRMTLFDGADISTVLHELGHVALHDMHPNDVAILDRQLAGGRSALRGEWTRQDHERYARAWERYFLEGYASSTSLRSVFQKLKQWMGDVYRAVVNRNEPISEDVRQVFDRRLGKVGIEEADAGRVFADPRLTRWGVQLSQAKNELEAYEARAEIARRKGTDEALRAELETKIEQREKAQAANDQERWDDLTTEIRSIEKELDDRDALNSSRVRRRHGLLTSRAAELEKALKKPDSRRYEGAKAAADYFQSERETILRDVFGDAYDDIFSGRNEQMSNWLIQQGVLDPDMDLGPAEGMLPFRRREGVRSAFQRQGVRAATAPVTRRFGRSRTADLNLNVRNQMLLWQQGDYRADIGVLHENYMRALSFKYQHDLRRMLHEIGEPVDASGPKKGWYIVDPDATPLPREWKGLDATEVDAEVRSALDGLSADDAQLSLQLLHFAENWLHTDPGKARRPDGGYGNVKQVHPRIVHALMLPYSGNQLWNPVVKYAQVPNTLARMSLIYTAPGYIPSNILANAVMLFGERGIFALGDMAIGAGLVMKDSWLARKIGRWIGVDLAGGEYAGVGRLARAETGESITTSATRTDSGEVLGYPRKVEGTTARLVSSLADDWMRVAAWSGIASKHGYKGRGAQLRLLEGKTEKTRRDRDRISNLATRAMIDFDRLAPWEQRWLRPIVFVWPFMRGATAWPLDYIKAHPTRAGAYALAAEALGEEQREELGPVPAYSSSLVPIEGDEVMNLQSINPIGTFGEVAGILGGNIGSLATGEEVPAFRDLSGFLAPHVDLTLQIIRAQGDFGSSESLQKILKDAGPEYAPWGTFFVDALDETKPAAMLDQGWVATLKRKTIRFSPQRMNLAILNQQAEERGDPKTPTQKMVEARTKARSAWNQIVPGDHMPRVIEDSIKAYYTVQEMRTALREEIKKNQRASWQPTKRDPTLQPLQEAAIVYDVFSAQHPDMVEGLPDPREIFDQYGEEAVNKYRLNIERSLFMGKRRADEAIRRAKLAKKAAA